MEMTNVVYVFLIETTFKRDYCLSMQRMHDFLVSLSTNPDINEFLFKTLGKNYSDLHQWLWDQIGFVDESSEG